MSVATPSRSARAAQLCADTGISRKAAADRFGITPKAVWYAWRQLFGDRPPETVARRKARNAQIVALARQGWTAQRLAARFGLRLWSIKIIARRRGVLARDAYNVDPEALKGALRLVRRGATYREAARIEGISDATVARAARRAGLSPGKARRGRRDWALESFLEKCLSTDPAESDIAPGTGHYRPLDAILSDWCVLVLRAARRFDWFEPGDLTEALEVPSTTEDRRARDCFNQAMSKLTRRRHLERRGRPMAYQYRITEAGRLEYERQLKRSAA